jgi:hypothetical protein
METDAKPLHFRSSSMKRRRTFAAMLCAFGLVTNGALASGLQGTPFESGANARAIEQLAQGTTVKRTSADNTLTQEDRSRFRAIGLPHTHSAAVVLHKIQRTDDARQRARLADVARSIDKLAGSEACDRLVSTGEGKGVCTGHVDGPFGKVPVRLTVAARLTQSPDGAMHLVLTNSQPLEAKGLFSWTEVVAPGHLKVAYDMFPTEDGWLVHARVGVEMKKHERAAKDISDALLKLESWLTRDLARS